MNKYLDVNPEVAAAIAEGKPVVALESTIISHGMPYPQNVETALNVERIIRENGAVPATIAIIGGRLKAGLTAEEIEYYKDNFGKVEFVYDPTLDDLGYADFMVVIDIKNARRYVHTDNKEYTIDMKKGAGENREAERNVTIQADAIALKGYNSLLVGPSSMLESMNVADAATNVELVTVVPENPSDGQLIFLTAADAGLNLEADKAYRWDAATGKWVAYTGAVAIA